MYRGRNCTVTLNFKGVQQLLKSDEIQNALYDSAKDVADTANSLANASDRKNAKYTAQKDTHKKVATAHVWSNRDGAHAKVGGKPVLPEALARELI